MWKLTHWKEFCSSLGQPKKTPRFWLSFPPIKTTWHISNRNFWLPIFSGFKVIENRWFGVCCLYSFWFTIPGLHSYRTVFWSIAIKQLPALAEHRKSSPLLSRIDHSLDVMLLLVDVCWLVLVDMNFDVQIGWNWCWLRSWVIEMHSFSNHSSAPLLFLSLHFTPIGHRS